VERIAGHPISKTQVLYEFGTYSSESFACGHLMPRNVRRDVTEQEMLEMLGIIRTGGEVTEWVIEHWINCLKENTGDPQFSDLLFWPNVYFQRDDPPKLSPAEILDTALRASGKRNQITATC
jgi:hypothetical protein